MKNKRKDNGKIPKWAIALIIVFSVIYIAFFAVLCYFIYLDETSSEFTDIKPVLNNTYYDELNEAYLVSGYITNDFDEDYFDVEVYYALYDEDNNILGYAYDSIDWIEEGDTWKFTCEYYGLDSKDVYRVEFEEMNGW